MVVNSYIIIGASSEVAKEFIEICEKNNIDLLLITRKNNKSKYNSKIIYVDEYIDDYKVFKKHISKNINYKLFFFNGALFENRPIKIPTELEISEMHKINYQIPVELTKKLSKEFPKITKYIYISSMAAVKYRPKNFIYGQQKRNLEKSISEMGLNSFLIFRFGKIMTKMSESHTSPPFTFTSKKSAEIIYRKINLNGIKYPSTGLKIISYIIKLTPQFIINKLTI